MPISGKPEETHKLSEKQNLPILNPEEIENMNRPITSNEIETDEKSSNKQKSRNRCLHRQILSNI